jgi:hypothetical protein
VYPFENHFRSVGGHFIRIIHDRVYFVHETAREFLLKEEGSLTTAYAVADGDNDDDITLWEDDDLHGPPLSIPISTWYHSISLSSCHALLLDICVTYIYMVGKLGIKSPNDFDGDVSKFLDYASKSWTVHFRGVSDIVQPWNVRNVPYYHNLCHTAFPGFSVWTSQCWDGTQNDLFGLSADEEQDYYIQYFGIEVGQKSQRGNTGTGLQPSIEPIQYDGAPSHERRATDQSALLFSSNPMSKEQTQLPYTGRRERLRIC